MQLRSESVAQGERLAGHPFRASLRLLSTSALLCPRADWHYIHGNVYTGGAKVPCSIGGGGDPMLPAQRKIKNTCWGPRSFPDLRHTTQGCYNAITGARVDRPTPPSAVETIPSATTRMYQHTWYVPSQKNERPCADRSTTRQSALSNPRPTHVGPMYPYIFSHALLSPRTSRRFDPCIYVCLYLYM